MSSLSEIEAAAGIQLKNGYIIETPVVDASSVIEEEHNTTKVYLKLENVQVGGSFKMRGVSYSFHQLLGGGLREPQPLPRLVTMSAGNYGKSFAMMAKKMHVEGVVCMPDTAPTDRRALIQNYGVSVDIMKSSELLSKVRQYVDQEGMVFLHPFDDPTLIVGHGSLGLELYNQFDGNLDQEDSVIVIPCGGGGLLAGVSNALRLKGCTARIVGVEPEGAPGQFNSRVAGEAVTKLELQPTIASGLAPPFAGENAFALIQKNVDQLVLVNDQEMKHAIGVLYDRGLVVEPSGSASLAALLAGKIDALENKKVICIVSGGNIAPSDLAQLIRE